MTTIKQVHSGLLLDLDNLKPAQILIDDIVHSLSLLCRFNGHTKRFYSVAEHCIAAANLLPPELELWGLLHDAAETYVGDLSSPMKRRFPDVKKFEYGILYRVARRFGLVWPPPLEIKEIDTRLLATEARDLLGVYDLTKWKIPPVQPYKDHIFRITGRRFYFNFFRTRKHVYKSRILKCLKRS